MRQPFVICQFMCRGVKTVAVSDGFCDLFGYTDREQAYTDMNLNMFKNVHPEDTAGFTHALLRFGTEGGRIELLYRNKKSDGTGYRVIRLVGEHVSEGSGVELAHLWFADEGDYHDTSDREYSQRVSQAVRKDNLENTVRYDYPTGLPNLSYFFELAEVARKLILDEGGDSPPCSTSTSAAPRAQGRRRLQGRGRQGPRHAEQAHLTFAVSRSRHTRGHTDTVSDDIRRSCGSA
jgi:hypothetical protein